MTTTPESRFYQRLRENLSDCHITRIESRVNQGIPDCLLAFRDPGIFVMVELKVVKRGRKVALSPHQIAFHAKHADMNCLTFILVQYFPPKATRSSQSEVLLYAGKQAVELAQLGVRVEPIAGWPWTGVPWDILKQHLLDAMD